MPKTQLLTAESITPLEPYLSRRRSEPASYPAQYEFAVILLAREEEYVRFHSARWHSGEPPGGEPAAPWEPWNITPDAAARLAASWAALRGDEETAPAPWDLFGFKEEAADGLRAALGRKASAAAGYLVLAKLCVDLTRYDDAIAAARETARLAPSSLAGWGYVYHAASLSGSRAEREARRHASARDLTTAMSRHESSLRNATWRIRARTEGERFTRFLRTEREFCEEERARTMAGVDEGAVPAEFRDLLPLARTYGVGDDACRGYFVRRATPADRHAVKAQLAGRASAIGAWLDSFGGATMPPHAAAFLYLLEAHEEMAPRRTS